ncbi:MAG: hypothetical protein OES84_03260 [Kiritimatiellaceae bacterium]|nr:hypothetical protein [Kiritimatiellaceae bacterium]
MKCQNAEKLILLKDSGEIKPEQNRVLKSHLSECEACRQFQQVLSKSLNTFQTMEEPSAKVMQNVLRVARVNAPEKELTHLFGLKPALATAASLLIALGILFATFNPDKVGMEFVITKTQLLESEDQIVSVIYDGFSEDDLAFNFLMTYEDNYASL